MKLFKWYIKNYFYALTVLLMLFGVITVFRPERALELMELLEDQSLIGRLYILLLMNFLWSISFMLFDLWNEWRVTNDNPLKPSS